MKRDIELRGAAAVAPTAPDETEPSFQAHSQSAPLPTEQRDLPNNAAQELPAARTDLRTTGGSVPTRSSGEARTVPCRRSRHSCWRCGQRIQVDHITPPIPTTDYDWRATFDNYDGAPDAGKAGMQGYGPTERAAVDDLLDQHQEDCSPSPEHVARTIAENEDDQKGCYG